MRISTATSKPKMMAISRNTGTHTSSALLPA